MKRPARQPMRVWRERAERIWRPRPKDKHTPYALHAPEAECIGKGKARKPCEFGVKVGIAVTATQGLIVDARSVPGNPCDGDTLTKQIEHTHPLMQDAGTRPKVAITDLDYRGREVEGVRFLPRGKAKSPPRRQGCRIKRRQSVEPVIAHLEQEHQLDRHWIKGALGDALNALGAAAGCNIRWLMRQIALLHAWIQETQYNLAGDSMRVIPATPNPCMYTVDTPGLWPMPTAKQPE